MKSILRIAALASIFTLLGFCSIGCAPTVNPPTAPVVVGTGYVNIDDQRFQQAIGAAETFYTDTQNNVNNRTLVPSPTTITALNAFGVALIATRQLVLDYHNNPTSANLTTTNTAVTNLTNNQTTLTAAITGGK